MTMLLDQFGISSGMAEFALLIPVYIFYGTVFNLMMPSSVAQRLVPPWICDVWHKMSPKDASE